MQKIIALFLVVALTSACTTVPNSTYGNNPAPNEQRNTSSLPAKSNDSFWTANTIFWTVITFIAIGAAAKAASKNSGDKTCYTGPRGGTYTITANGNKNYSGC